MANTRNIKNSAKKNFLNNSNPDLFTAMANQGNIQLTNRNNFFDEKENSVEKNVRQQNHPRPIAAKEKAILRPALRTIAIQKQAQQQQQLIQQQDNEMLLTTPKITKQIRFNLGSGHNDSSDMMTPTPPPKEFKRMNSDRKTLRNNRCMSTVITEKERAIMFENQIEQHMDSPKAPSGFVKSMCKLYSDNFGLRKAQSCGPEKGTDLNRSNSFSGTTTRTIKEDEELDENEGSPFSERRSGSFRLFRSRSWSLRRKKGQISPELGNEPRLSPSYSVKSQDSGFSDSGEGKVVAPSIQRTQFFTGAEFEDESDPNLTQIPDFLAPSQIPSKEVNPASTLRAKEEIEKSLGNIASIHEGMRLKRSFLDEEGQEIVSKSVHHRRQGADNLLQVGQTDVDKLVGKKQLDNLADMSCDMDSALPVFSTPVRASFRRRMVRPKTSVAFHLEDAKTPSKRETKSKLKEMKARRRWSNIELAELQEQLCQDQQSVVNDTMESVNVFERSDVPSCIEPSLVAVWSQFLSYEPSLHQLTLSSSGNSCLQKEQLLSTSASSSQQLLSDTRLSYMAPSLCVDGTSTQLLVQSFNHRQSLELDSQRSLLHYQSMSDNVGFTSQCRDNEETIIELEAKSLLPMEAEKRDFNASPRSTQQFPSFVTTSPVNEWWRDLHAWCEPECMTYLQSKPILSSPQPPASSASSSCGRSSSLSSPSSPASTSSMVSVETSTSIVEAIRKIQRSAKSVQVTFTALNNHFNSMNLVQMSKTVQVLLTQIQEHIFEYNLGKSDFVGPTGILESDRCEWNFPGLRKTVPPAFEGRIDSGDKVDQEKGLNEILMLQQRTVLQLADRLKLCTHRCQYTPQQPLAEMKRIMMSLHKSFKTLVEKMINKEIKPLIREIAQPTSEIGIRSALHTVIHLGNEGPNSVCSLIAQEGGIRALLKHCKLPASLRQTLQHQDIRVLSLRGLSAICCMADCIRELENCNGLSVIDELLSSRHSSLEDRIEAAGLLAQITSPWITDNHKIENLDSHVASMVSSLTALSRLNGGEETFLLVTAALANLTFMSPLSASAMKQFKTAQALVNVVRSTMRQRTLFSKDQVVTVLANLAANANIRHDIQTLDGVGFLISMLETKIHPNLSQAEESAAERVQKKSAIALSRLCNDSTVCRDLLRLGGIDRLVELCKNPSERNYSDAVLVACLAVLRRVKHNLESKMRDEDDRGIVRTSEDSRNLNLILDQLDATDLVQPKLVDSFVEYSSGKHSYV